MFVKKIKEVVRKKLVNGTLPDIDTDFAGRDRAAVKEYMEERFGKDQVCSVGTVTTMKPKGLIKDFDRQFDNDFLRANFITSILDEKDVSMLDVFKRAAQEPRLKTYIKENSDIFHMMPVLLGQPKVKSIHSCAMIIFPNVLKAREWAPMRTQNNSLVSEWGGGEMEDAGFLKDDILGIKQLDKFTDILRLIKKNKKEVPDIYNIPEGDKEVYRYFCNGWNGDVFHLGSTGMTQYTKKLKPQTFDDLVATVALNRPGPMENHFHEIYIQCKNEGRKPKYLWGTEEITKDTYSLIIYQEQIMKICQEVGGLSLREADEVRRAMGKKKLKVLESWEDRVREGFLKKGATEEEFQEAWDVMIEFAKYSFNLSHSAVYAQTGYVGQWLKVHFPLEYWTVALDYADEKKTLLYLSEIAQAKKISIFPPDINKSFLEMSSNLEDQSIYWGISSIKGIGEQTAEQIISERNKNGKYKSLVDFIERNSWKGSRVKKQTYEALIASGAFDKLHEIGDSVENRGILLKSFREIKKVKIANPDKDVYGSPLVVRSWWWILKQKILTGFAFFDYADLAQSVGIETRFCSVSETNKHQMNPIHRAFGGYVVECRISKSKNGPFARLTIENNYTIHKIVIWNEQYEEFKEDLQNCEKSIILFTADLRYEEKWTRGNQFTFTDNSSLVVLK